MNDEVIGFVNVKDDPLYQKGYEAAYKEMAEEMQYNSNIISLFGERSHTHLLSKVKELEDGMAEYYVMIQNQDKAAIDELRSEVERLEAQRAESDQQVADACAKVCKELVAWQPNGSMQSIGDRCAEHIHSGEWKKHMKGGE